MGGKRKDKLPEGVEIRYSKSGQTSLRIQFYYKGVLCRESFKLEATPANIKFVARKRIAALEAIEKGTFKFPDFFPDSDNALRFGHVADRVLIRTLLDTHLEEKKNNLESSTYVRYERSCRTHIYPNFSHMFIQDLTCNAIRGWIKKMKCQRKTISNILTPLKAIVRRALSDNFITYNPFDQLFLDEILSKTQKRSQFRIDPFNRDEINALLSVAEGQIKNLYQFAFFTGLRPSELMGLRWGDIDWVRGSIRVEETVVDKQVKGPKTEAGYRNVLLLPPAREALTAQKAHTLLMGKNVFHNPLTNKPWETSQQLRRTAWMHLLRKAGVRYRNPYQTRHTYASMMISKGEEVLWVSEQMGHADMEVTLKRYTSWIQDTKASGGYETHHDWSGYLSKIG